MKSLIIGAAGFVGKHLINYLKEKNEAICATKLPHEALTISGVDIVNLDILNQDDISKLLIDFQPDYIYHLAAQSSVSVSWSKPALTIDVNIKGTVNLLEAARFLEKKPRILLIGSGEEYGYISSDDLPLKEETPLRPGNIYAGTKIAQGIFGQIYEKAYKLDIIIIRAFSHTGPGQTDTFVLPSFCKQIAMIEAGISPPIIKVGNLDAKRDFTDVRDVVSAYYLLAKKGISGEIYNVGNSNSISIRTLLDKVLALSKIDITVELDPARMRPSDVPIIEADVSKLTSQTGWTPQIPLDVTVIDVLNEWRKLYKKH